MHAALAEHFGGLPRAVWSGCCTACILQGNARLSGRVDGLGAQLAAVGASASEEHERAAAALTASLLAKRLSCQEGRAAALALAARIDNFEAEEDGSPKLSAVYHEVRFRAGPSVAPFDKLSHHAALVDTMLACGLLVWMVHPLPHKPEGSYARVAVSAGLLTRTREYQKHGNQTVETRPEIKGSNATPIPLIPSHWFSKSKQSKSRDSPRKY